jgi:hypothetical protein
MLARLFFRLCALEALRPSALLASDTGWPTLAGKFVSDSRIDPIDDITDDTERRPLIAVYTEATHLDKIAQAGPILHKPDVDLVLDISVVSKFAVDGGQPIIDYCETDGQTEGTLDVLESQIYDVLHFAPSGALFRRMAKGIAENWESTPHRSAEEAIRLARREIRARFCMKETFLNPAPATAPTDLARLPAALQSVAAALNGSTYLADLVLGAARSAFVMPTAVNLNSVGLTMAPQPGTNNPAPVQGTADNLQGG